MNQFLTSAWASCALAAQAAGNQQMSLSPRQLLAQMSWLGVCVVVVLLVMSIYSIAVILERWLTFRSAARQSREFVTRAAELLRTARLDDALKLSQTYPRSHLAVVVNSGLQELAGAGGGKTGRQMRKARRALRRATAMKTAELQRGLSALATVGSTAPFVGLFGTVLGIIDAFQSMNQEQTAGFTAVAGGLSEALVTTAFGILVAIPAVWMFNYFVSRVGVFTVEMENSGDELIDFFTRQRDAEGGRP